MGSETSRHRRRHTVTAHVATPYIKSDQAKLHGFDTDQSAFDNRTSSAPHIKVPPTHPHGIHAYSAEYPSEYPSNKMLRSLSTTAIPRPTKDHKASTPKQNLITSVDPPNKGKSSSKSSCNTPRKLSKNTLFPFKAKLKSHHQAFHSAIPYIHFNDESQTMDKNQKKSKLQRSSSRRFTNNKPKRKKSSFIRNAFSSNEEHSSSLDIGYHSDPSNITHTVNTKKYNIKRTKRRATVNGNTNGKSNGRYNPHHHKKHDLYTRRHWNNDKKDDDKNKRKILLLGNGSCGKSTIFKQLKLILANTNTFDENEISEATHAIRQNCVSVLLGILYKCPVLYAQNNQYFADCHLDENNEAIRDAINYVMKYRAESFEKVEEDLSELSESISYLWNLSCVQTVIKFRHKRFTIPDNIHYFYEQIDSIFKKNYVPTTDDIIRLRIRTTGMIESKFTILGDNNCDEYQLSLFDTGGERNERKKWIHTFDNVDIVVFVAALSHFCCVLWEDEKTLSMHDAIDLFQEICNGKWFKRSEMILFLNKNDIFRQMLYDGISLKCGFSDIRNEDYCIKLEHPEITPPPSPNGVNFGFPSFVDGDSKQKKNVDEKSIEKDNKSNSDLSKKVNVKQSANDNDDEKGNNIPDENYIPYKNLNAWTGNPWNGPNFKYDTNKTVEENNIAFEKCYDKAIEYIVSLFLKQNKDPNRTIYVHITNAIDEKNISDVFDEIRPLIINSNYAGNAKQFL